MNVWIALISFIITVSTLILCGILSIKLLHYIRKRMSKALEEAINKKTK